MSANAMKVQPDTPPVEITILIEASPEIVASFITDPKKMSAWFGNSAEFVAGTGNPYKIFLTNDTAIGTFVEVSAHRIVMTWGWEGGAFVPPGSTRLTFELVPEGKATRLTLRHENIHAERREQHAKGWGEHLQTLKRVAEAL